MKQNRRIQALMPLIVFLAISLVLFRGLHLHPEKIPSPLIDQPAPTFSLPSLEHPETLLSSEQLFAGHITLLNIWASWCSACHAEHTMLMQLSHEPGIVLIGLNYRDVTDSATEWLKRHGNPYQTVVTDVSGKTGIDWGVYGTPETFVIDRHGIIRYRQIGAINPESWQTILRPLIRQLIGEK